MERIVNVGLIQMSCGDDIEENYDIKKLESYSKKINNTGVIRRLGYLCDVLQIPIELPKIKTKNYLSLDQIFPKKGETNSKWRLYINTDMVILNDTRR